VKLAEHCRQAGTSPTVTEVREALAVLSSEDDFRVQALASSLPEASPLSPFAVVDILWGTEPAIAAQREACGYYRLARELIKASETTSAVADRIAPRKKRAAPVEAETTPPASDAAAAVPFEATKRALPKPRGRFTTLDGTRAPLEELRTPEGRDTLENLLAQHHHRPALLLAVGEQYMGRSGKDVTAEDLDAILESQGLLSDVVRRERELLVNAFETQRGAKGRAAWTLGTTPHELERWIDRLGVREPVDALRERFRREALGASQWTTRLDLLGRDKYLSDLGIADRFEKTLRRDLNERFAQVDSSGEQRIERVARDLGVPMELLARAAGKLALAGSAQSSSTSPKKRR
jgi:hypothetical protein